MNLSTALAIAVPAMVAITSVVVGYVSNLRSAERKFRLDVQMVELNAQIDRVNRQLRELYGPLLALSAAGGRSWDAFRSCYRNYIPAYWDRSDPPSDEEAEAWRAWMTEVFHPGNVRMEELVVSKADLLDSDEMPDCLLDLVAHVASYRTVLANWARGDYRINTAPMNFPSHALNSYVQEHFQILKERQRELLGIRARHGSDDLG